MDFLAHFGNAVQGFGLAPAIAMLAFVLFRVDRRTAKLEAVIEALTSTVDKLERTYEHFFPRAPSGAVNPSRHRRGNRRSHHAVDRRHRRRD